VHKTSEWCFMIPIALYDDFGHPGAFWRTLYSRFVFGGP